jgi:UDP-N-acetylmuramoyl-tripeptide--D-alanyl-D-alanine ligase
MRFFYFCSMNNNQLYDVFLKHPKVITDSRMAVKKSIFFALKGEHFDGNNFAREALAAGCSFAVVDHYQGSHDDRIIQVENVLQSLQDLARHHRRRLGLRILAITGSNGKTTTKELLARVLGKKLSVEFTRGNLNNHIGVPLTLLQMSGETELGIVEMGANHIGEIAELCRIAEPDFGIITNIGKAHLEGFGSPEGVKQAKGELYDYLSHHDRLVFLNHDREDLREMAFKRKLKVFTYGTSDKVDCKGCYEGHDDGLRVWYSWAFSHKSGEIHASLYGSYNFENILCAISAGLYFGVQENAIKEAVEEYRPANHRSQIIHSEYNQIIMDAYNANPSSMKASISEFLLRSGENKLLILGDMFELGQYSMEEHQEILRQLNERGVKDCLLVGREFEKVAGMHFRVFPDVRSLNAYLKVHIMTGKQILIKGSRGVHLEECLEYL